MVSERVPDAPGSRRILLELKAKTIEVDERVADKVTVPFNPALESVSVEVPEFPATKLAGTIAVAAIVNSGLTVTDTVMMRIVVPAVPVMVTV
jgi:hypothetical protein